MPKTVLNSRSRRNHRGLSNSRNHLARRDVFHRPLRCEPLEDRCLLSVAPLDVVLVSDAVAQAQQVRDAAATDTVAIVYHADTMTTTGLVDLGKGDDLSLAMGYNGQAPTTMRPSTLTVS